MGNKYLSFSLTAHVVWQMCACGELLSDWLSAVQSVTRTRGTWESRTGDIRTAAILSDCSGFLLR